MTKLSRDPHDRLADRLAGIERRLRAMERGFPQVLTLEGPRTDLPAGRGPRVRIGLLSDDTYGAERWAEDGTHSVADWV